MPDFPEFPINPQGPSEQQPEVNTQLSDSLNRIATSVDKQAESAERIADALKRVPSVAEEISRKFKNVNIELEAMVELADDTEEAIKLIASQTKSLRKGIIDTKKAKDAHNVLKSIIEAQKTVQGQLKKGSQGWASSVKIVKELNQWVDKLANRVDNLSEDELKSLNKAMHEAEKTGERMAKNFKSMTVNHLTRQVQGMTRALASVGIGKAYAAKVEKYSKFAEVPYKMREAQKARLGDNRDAFRRKRESALDAVRAQYGGDMANPKAQMALAKEMGIGALRRRRMSGADLSALAGRGTTETVTSMETHGIGGLGSLSSKAATGLEDAMGSLGGLIAEIGPVIAAAEGAVMLLVQAFDGYVKQNKELEAGLGKGGLFGSQQGGGGFTGARAALTPNALKGGVYSDLGISFERNLKIAQAMTEGGQSISDLVNQGQRSLMTGGRGVRDRGAEFGTGAFGEIQRSTVGAGRLAGMTDAEGVSQILKMMGQYRETLEQSEDFFIKIRKATAAAGISTTKYIAILDEVLGRFGRMNKTMDQAVAILGDLSKTGRLASEDLQGYFDFLTGGAGAKEKTGSATQMFLYGQMSQGQKREELGYRQQAYDSTAGKAGSAFEGLGIDPDELTKGLQGTNEQVQAFLTNRVTQAIDNSTALDKTQKQSMNGMVERLRKQKQDVDLWDQFSSGKISAVQMGQGQTVGGTSMLDRMALQRKAVGFMLDQSGSMADFIANPQKFAASNPQAPAIAKELGISPEDLGSNLAGIQRTGAGLRIDEAKGDGSKADKLMEQLLKNPANAKLIKELKKDGQSNSQFFAESGSQMVEGVAGLESTLDYWSQAAAKKQDEATQEQRKQALDEARKVAKQTQSSADIMANAFSKWFTEIISGIEFIVNWLDSYKLFGGKTTLSEGDRGAVADKLHDIGKKIPDLQEQADKLRAEGNKDSEASAIDKQVIALQKQSAQLSAMQDQGSAQTDAQKALLKEVQEGHQQKVAAAVAGSGYDIKTATGWMSDNPDIRTLGAPNVPTGVPGMEKINAAFPQSGGAANGRPNVNYVITNTYQSAEINQQTANLNGVNKSADAKPLSTKSPFMPKTAGNQ